ncbi:4880_t:CDS:1, partial [Cetraspora pellucida]
KYEEWPEHQQSAAREKLNNLINTLLTVLQNPKLFVLEEDLLVPLIIEKIIQPEETLLGLS